VTAPASATKDRILDAAEMLFAVEGLSRTSLRAITARAGVNVAAIHYHFGSRDKVLEAVFARRVAPANAERLAWLDRLEAEAGEAPPSLEAVLEAFVAPPLRVSGEGAEGGPSLAQLVGRFYVEPEDRVEHLLRDQFAEVAARFVRALARAVPELSPEDVAWRFRLTIGVLVHVLTGKHALGVIPETRIDAANREEAIERVVAFCAAGFRGST